MNKSIEEIETEYKAMIKKEKYNELFNYFSHFTEDSDTYVQTNYYFDIEGYVFIKNGITVRIRNKKCKWIFQIKIPDIHNIKGTYNQHQEINKEIPEVEALRYIKDGIEENNTQIIKLYELIGETPKKLTMIGNLKTKRTDFHFYTDTISLDESSYLDVTDYELEWETQNHSFVTFELNRLGIVPIQGVGKITRFLERLLQNYKN